MRLLLRSLGSPLPVEVDGDPAGTLQALLERLRGSGKLPQGDGTRLVHHGRVLRDRGARLGDLCCSGDVLVVLPGRRTAKPEHPPAPPPKGPSAREINAAIREDLAAQGPATLAAAEAAAARDQAAAAAGPPPMPPGPGTAALEEYLLTGEADALRTYLQQLQEAVRDGVAEGGGAVPLAAALDAFLGLGAGGGGGGGAGNLTAVMQAMVRGAGGLHGQAAPEEEDEEEEEDGDELHRRLAELEALVGEGHEDEDEEDEDEFDEDEEDEDEDEEEDGAYTDEEDEEGEGSEEEGQAGGGLPPVQVPELDAAALASLQEMGFPEALCRNALLMGRNRFDPALEWLLANAEDPAAAEPLSDAQLASLYGRRPAPAAGGASRGAAGRGVDQGHLAHLIDMGFDRNQAEQALRVFGNSLPAAASWLLNVGAVAAEAPAQPAAGAAQGDGAQQQQAQQAGRAGEGPGAAAPQGAAGEEELPGLVSDRDSSRDGSSESEGEEEAEEAAREAGPADEEMLPGLASPSESGSEQDEEGEEDDDEEEGEEDGLRPPALESTSNTSGSEREE